jgi:hypothetical protein
MVNLIINNFFDFFLNIIIFKEERLVLKVMKIKKDKPTIDRIENDPCLQRTNR